MPDSDDSMSSVGEPTVRLTLENYSFNPAMLTQDLGFPALPGPTFASLVPAARDITRRVRPHVIPNRDPPEPMDTTSFRRSVKRLTDQSQDERNLRTRTEGSVPELDYEEVPALEHHEPLAVGHQQAKALTHVPSGVLVPVVPEERSVVATDNSQNSSQRIRTRSVVSRLRNILPPAYRRMGDPP